MENKERIKVFINIRKGKTVCICTRSRRGCGRNCIPDIVERDKFCGWEDTFKQDRYGTDKTDKKRGE